MRKLGCLCIALIVTVAAAAAQSQPSPKTDASKKADAPPKAEITFKGVLGNSVLQAQKTLLPLAMYMPENKYGFAPTEGEFKGVRTFAEQLKHVGAANFSFAAAIVGEKPPADVDEEEAGPASLKTKEEILRYLNDSFSYVKKAVATIDEKNVITPIQSPFGGETTRLAMTTLIVSHCYDHYGQMVEYLRMNGIVPPASQR
jgi:uncharacterized damage-inducible protein DinB